MDNPSIFSSLECALKYSQVMKINVLTQLREVIEAALSGQTTHWKEEVWLLIHSGIT